MKNLNSIASDLFNKIRGRFQDVTIGNKNGQVTNVPEDARYFDFSFQNNGVDLGKVSVSLDEDEGIVVVVGRDIVQNQEQDIQDRWFNFLKELRVFAKKRLLNFDVRDINKSNLNKRDYEFLAANRTGEKTMAETKMYGTNKTSFQKIGNARLVIKHQAPINMESTSGRTQKINAIFIESPAGERFRYPYKHLSGARAMAMHVSEGGHAYDDFGKYISGLSEEMTKLRKFNQYMNRSAVMAEGLKDYSGVVKERVAVVKKEIQNLQKPVYYAEALASYVTPIVEDVPADVAENWIDQLTIKQFNEELKDVFPYIYSLVGEATKAKELGPDDLDESGLQYYTGVKKHGKEYMKKAAQAGREGASQEELGRLKDKYSKAEKNTKEDISIEEAGLRPGPDFSLASKEYKGFVLGAEDDSDDDRRATMWAVYKNLGDDTYKQVSSVKDPKYNGKHPVSSFSSKVPFEEFKWTVDNFLAKTPEEFELEQAFEDAMGQFADHVCEDCGNPSWRTLSEEKQKGVDGKVCWKGYKRMGTKMKGGKRVDNCVKVSEAGDANFTTADLQQLQKMNNVDDVKRRAIELITTKSRKPMKPEKVAWFKRAIASKRTHMDVIKLMYDLMLSGDGQAVIGSRGSMASNSYRRTFGDDLEEAYINTSKDAIAVLGNLRKIGKSIELGQGSYDGNLAGMYVNDVYEVITWLQSNADTSDPKFKQIIAPVIELRKKAKSMEREPGSGKDAGFGNEIVNTLYPLMQWIEMNAQVCREADVSEGLGSMLKNVAGSIKNAFKPGVAITPGSVKQAEYILQKVLQGGFDGLNNRERQFMTNFSDATLKGLQAQAAEGEDKISKDKPTDMDVQIGPDGSIGKADAKPEKEQTPIGEYILSYFDRETGKFPKGETAVLTAVQKEYGDESVKPAAQFMKQIETVVAQKQAETMAQSRYPETEMIKRLAGV
jgi:hypothetical protein